MRKSSCGEHPEIRDYGGEPFVFNIVHATNMNKKFRTVIYTGQFLQLTLMSIPVGESIGVEMHPDVDQFIRVESGKAKVYMGKCKSDIREIACASDSDAILIPAGSWHNVINVGSRPLKLYSLYAPPNHPFGAMHHTKEDAAHMEHG